MGLTGGGTAGIWLEAATRAQALKPKRNDLLQLAQALLQHQALTLSGGSLQLLAQLGSLVEKFDLRRDDSGVLEDLEGKAELDRGVAPAFGLSEWSAEARRALQLATSHCFGEVIGDGFIL